VLGVKVPEIGPAEIGDANTASEHVVTGDANRVGIVASKPPDRTQAKSRAKSLILFCFLLSFSF
jgi:hypothetical protein